METALVTVATGVMKPLLSKLTKLLEGEYAKAKGMRKKIKFLRDELSAMSATLQMLADAEKLNAEMKDWRDKLRELAYDLEDCIDAFMARVDHEGDKGTGFNRFFWKLKKLKARLEIDDQMEELKARAIEASDRYKRYNVVQSSHNSGISSVDPRLSALYEEVERLVGIDGPKKRIIELLNMGINRSPAKLKVVSIVGCGGLGKTTLAKQVYDSIRSWFSCAAFVSVSQRPDVRKILRHILEGVGFSGKDAEEELIDKPGEHLKHKRWMQDDDEQQLIDKLRVHLQDKRYLIVIDDVWDAKSWEIIKLALMNNNSGSRIITTTRSTAVASCCCSQGGNVYQMKPLSFDDSKRLLFKRAFGYERFWYTHLGDVPDKILRKCNGLPLAIITISSMLTDQHAKSEWDRILNAIGSAFAKNPGAENMTTILSLSYFDTPHHLRTCLLYLSVFPEDYENEKQRVINRWIAEGFVHEQEGRTTYEIGERYFNDFINRSLIQPVDVKYGQAKACRVHDIILDYIKCKATEENFVTSLDAAEHGYTSEYMVRRLCVNRHNEENVNLWANLNLCHVRSFTVFGRPVETSLLPFTALRVLDLGDCSWHIGDHLASIEKVFHRKYLRLCSGYSITKLPEKIGALQYLQTLDVRGIVIKELPAAIMKLQRLAHLYVRWDTKFPDGMIGRMHSLEELRQYGVRSYKEGRSLQEFSKLTKLRTLKIRWIFCSGKRQAEGIHGHVGTLLSSCNIHNLYITDASAGFYVYPLSLDSWHPSAPCGLRQLCFKRCPIYKVPNWIGSLENLGVLKLQMFCVRPEDVEILGAIPSLVFLKLGAFGGTNGRIIVHGSNKYRSLKYFSLDIHRCGTLLEFRAGSMPKLEHVKLSFSLHKMECLNCASNSGIQHLSALSKVEVTIRGYCRYDSNYDPMADTDNGIVRRVAWALKAAVETLPNCPSIRFETLGDVCGHFECALRELNQKYGGVLTNWLKIWGIEEEQTEQAAARETEQEDWDDDEEEEDEQQEYTDSSD
uniref:AAA+ ATPase domain-containing protein n=1 Tax=Arundo donax TaxID=35708 RepID=A0A0A9FM52_ARUDO